MGIPEDILAKIPQDTPEDLRKAFAIMGARFFDERGLRQLLEDLVPIAEHHRYDFRSEGRRFIDELREACSIRTPSSKGSEAQLDELKKLEAALLEVLECMKLSEPAVARLDREYRAEKKSSPSAVRLNRRLQEMPETGISKADVIELMVLAKYIQTPVSLAKTHNEVTRLLTVVEKIINDIETETPTPSKRGRPPKLMEDAVADVVAATYEKLTGKPATRTVTAIDSGERRGHPVKMTGYNEFLFKVRHELGLGMSIDNASKKAIRKRRGGKSLPSQD